MGTGLEVKVLRGAAELVAEGWREPLVIAEFDLDLHERDLGHFAQAFRLGFWSLNYRLRIPTDASRRFRRKPAGDSD